MNMTIYCHIYNNKSYGEGTFIEDITLTVRNEKTGVDIKVKLI